jgi:putative pyoverdin transport system ATP-binding/permease protein
VIQERVSAAAIRLLRPFWPLAIVATALGGLSGVATAWLLAVINRAFHSIEPMSSLLLNFTGLAIVVLVGEITSDVSNAYIGQNVVAMLRKELTDKVMSAPIDSLEEFKVHRVIAALNQDIDTISNFTFAFSSMAIALSVTLGCIVYLLVLSPVQFGIVAIALVLGVAISTYARYRGISGFEASRAATDELQKHYRSITEGAKELRINRSRRSHVRTGLLSRTIDTLRDEQFRAMRTFMSANAFSDAVFWAAIALLIGMQASLGVDKTVLSGFVLVVLYVKGPINQLVGTFPLLVRSQISLKRVAELSRKFSNPEPYLLLDGGEAASSSAFAKPIDLVNIRYEFPARAGMTPFVLGPVTLSLNAGEILFVVGENGSGKTTLIKLLLGLYEPKDGVLLLDGKPVTPERRDDYRQLFSAIFFDYFLFEDIVVPGGAVRETITEYLAKFEIAHRVGIEDEKFTTTDLSTGQRKRLALIQVYLENRPVIVFDEWAAEQDPTFRRLFYDEFLPALKAQGKTMIVISHDDRYFGAADCVVHMKSGKIVEITKTE